MSVTIKCKKCGLLGMFTGDKDYKSVTKIVMDHKSIDGNKKHNVRVKRE